MNDTQSTGNKNVNNYKLEVDQLRQQIAALEAELAEARRRDSQIIALYERHRHLDTFLSDEKFPPIGKTGSMILYELWELVKQAAIDGGALEE